ncbi:hypothetical protein TCON_0974 [Astathelohania contejeani]|uniref:Uncharacterized protein n=1 Tax=Astathelohania contejeani TaxID=164912 RepID=A0ABQ7I033_9MICR|nr:hypothetical protein TCON_0974 [Thelohania contejeani]
MKNRKPFNEYGGFNEQLIYDIKKDLKTIIDYIKENHITTDMYDMIIPRKFNILKITLMYHEFTFRYSYLQHFYITLLRHMELYMENNNQRDFEILLFLLHKIYFNEHEDCHDETKRIPIEVELQTLENITRYSINKEYALRLLDELKWDDAFAVVLPRNLTLNSIDLALLAKELEHLKDEINKI